MSRNSTLKVKSDNNIAAYPAQTQKVDKKKFSWADLFDMNEKWQKPELDGLRGLAVLLVLFSHSSNIGNHFLGINFSACGRYGVYLFFILSSYLLDRQIAKKIKTRKDNKRYWLNYLMRRVLRIFPLYLFTLVLFSSINYFASLHLADNFSGADIFPHLMLQQGKSIFWSIPVEFKYYIFSPLLIYLIAKVVRWNYIGLLVLWVSSVTVLHFINSNHYLGAISMFRYLAPFLFGSFIALHEVMEIKFPKRILDTLPVLGLISMIVIFFTIPHYYGRITGKEVPLYYFHASFTMYGILWGIILLSLLNSNSYLNKIFSFKILRWFGKVSFSAYLLHALVLTFVERLDITGQLKAIIFLLITLIIASISFLLIEKPLSKIRISQR